MGGVKGGAALATIIAQFIVTVIFIAISRNFNLFRHLNIFKIPDENYIKIIFKLGLPAALQTGLFACIAMIIARIIANWGGLHL